MRYFLRVSLILRAVGVMVSTGNLLWAWGGVGLTCLWIRSLKLILTKRFRKLNRGFIGVFGG